MFGRAGSSLHEPLHSASPDDDEFAVPLADADYELTDSSWSTEGLNAAFALLSLPPDATPALKLARAKLRRARVPVKQFVDGTLTYVLSRQWKDLLAIYVFRLHPLPYCAQKGECTRTHPSSDQLVFACCMLVAAAGAVRVAEALDASRWPNAAIVPAMAGMCAGWALGDAGVQALVEIDHQSAAASAGDASGSGEAAPTHNSANLAFAAVVTLASAVVILALQASAAFCGRCWAWCADGDAASSGDAAGCLEQWCGGRGSPTAQLRQRAHSLRSEVGAQLGSQRRLLPTALQAATSIVWSYALRSLIVSGLPKDERGGPVYERMLVLWAATLTAGLALVSTKSVACRRWLGARRRGRHAAVAAALVGFLELMEGAFGWVTGCAWVDAVVSLSALAEYPTPVVTLKDVGLALASTLAGGAFLALRGEAPSLALADDQRASREEVELFFFTGAICWAVGWCWIVVLRDLATLLSPNAAGLDHLTALLYFCLFGPVLTYLLLRSRRYSLGALAGGGSRPPSRVAGTLAPAAAATAHRRVDEPAVQSV